MTTMFRKIFAVALASAISSVAFASPSTQAPQAPVAQAAQVQQPRAAQDAASMVGDAPEAIELRKWTKGDCASACRAQQCSGYEFVSNGHGDGSCRCTGCSQ
jgi:hypothetical protein